MKIVDTFEKFIIAIYGGFVGAIVSFHAMDNPFGVEVWGNIIYLGFFVLILLLFLNKLDVWINKIKNLFCHIKEFFFKEKPKAKELVKKINIENEEFLEIRKEEKEVPKIKEDKEEKHKEKFQEQLDYLIDHKEEIAKDKKERELKIVEKGIVLDKKVFIFDKEGMKFFNEDFNLPKYDLFVSYAKKSYYLCRKNRQTEKESSFHRLFMNSEINEFCIKNKCEPEDVEVHHKESSGDNSKDNLEILSISEHKRKHGK